MPCFFRLLPPLLFSALSAHAASIDWQLAANTNGKSNLIEGTPIYAVSGGTGATISNAGESGAQTIVFTGVNYTNLTFSPMPGARVTADVSNGAATTGDGNFDTVVKSVTDALNNIASGTQTISGLTVGKTYAIQIFYNDQRAGLTGRVMTFGDGAGSPQTVSLTAGGSGWGQYAVGTFTATATTQALTHLANGFGNAHFNAILVMELDPNPAPTVPQGVVAFPGKTNIALDWEDNYQTNFSHFSVKRSSMVSGPFVEIAQTSTSSYNNTGLAQETTYFYTVSAVTNGDVESAPSAVVSATTQNPPPNILFIITDDQDTYSVGAYRRSEPSEADATGNRDLIDTPNIDRLADQGMLFHQARIMGGNEGAVCAPSRTMIMTGRSTWHRTVSSAASTMPGLFNAGGYDTFRTCKLGNSYDLANAAFTTRHDATKRGNTPGNGSEWHADRALDYLGTWNSGGRAKPFLMYLGFSHPHDERLAQPSLAARYGFVNTTNPASITVDPRTPPLPANYLGNTGATPFPVHPFDNGHLSVRDEKDVLGVLTHRTEAVVRNEIARNFACVDYIDQQIGRVLAKLEDPNGDGNKADSVLDNTYIVFTSDHGIAIGRHGLMGKQNLYEHTLRVPYIVRGPGIAAGSSSNALVYLHDTLPTLLDLAGIPIPSTIGPTDGKSLRPVLEQTATKVRDHLYSVYAGGDKPGIRSVTDGRWKLIKYDAAETASQHTQLFDLQSNPFELLPEHGVSNLADHPAFSLVREEMEEQLTLLRQEFEDPYAMLGDRTLHRFEEGTAGQPVGTVASALPISADGTALSGNGSSKPIYVADAPAEKDGVLGDTNALAIDFERDNQHHILIPGADALSFGAKPFTIEAWVKLETLPTGNNAASTSPIVTKRATGTTDSNIDYMFLATSGVYGGTANFNKLALVLGGATVTSSLSINDTGWHYVSVAFNPNTQTVRFVLDDTTETKTTTATGVANSGPLLIGAHFNGSGMVDYAFDGLIDEVSVASGFFAANELQPLQDTPVPGPFAIVDTQLTSPNVTLTFESDPRLLYHLYGSETLQSGSWTLLQSYIESELTGSTTTHSVPMGGGDKEFYRFEATPPIRP